MTKRSPLSAALARPLAKAVGTLTAAVVLLIAMAVGALAQKIPCQDVVRELHRVERRGRARAASAEDVAKSLGTSSAWVERCATTYGRRLQTDELSSQRREAHERLWESREPEEIGREERETANDVVVDALPYRDKDRQRAFRSNEEGWAPVETDAWKPNTGRQWSPYLYDPHRTVPDDLEGVIRD